MCLLGRIRVIAGEITKQRRKIINNLRLALRSMFPLVEMPFLDKTLANLARA